MKTILEEYGFVILIAIVVIMLVVMASPIGGTIKASVLGLVDDFNSKTTAKIDKTNKEVNTTLKGSELTIESISETDKYIAILRGYQGGKEVSVASVDNKLTCTDGMNNASTFAGATGHVETTGGIAKFNIKNGTKLDENTEYYIEIMNIGTGEIFKSDIAIMDYRIGMSNINTILAVGDFSTKGNLVTVNGAGYRVLETSGAQVKLLAMGSYKSSKFNSSSVTTDFNGTKGQKYAGSALDGKMTNFYNSLPAELQNAIVEQNINQTMYSFLWSVPTGSIATSIASDNNDYIVEKKGEVNVGNLKVYALDMDDILSYLGSNFTWQQLNKMVFDAESKVSRYVWLRSAHPSYSYSAFYVYGSGGYLYN